MTDLHLPSLPWLAIASLMVAALLGPIGQIAAQIAS